MRLTRFSLRRWIYSAASMAGVFGLWLGGSKAAEYLKAGALIPESLAERPTSTESLGEVPKNRLAEQVLFPSVNLKRIREGLRPTGIAFVDDATYSLAPRSYYRRVDLVANQGVAEEAAFGGSLGLETGWLGERVRFGFAGYSSIPLYTPDDRGGTGLLANNGGEYTVLGEAYAELRAERTFLTVGWQRLKGPFINDNDSRMTPNTFEGALLSSTNLEPLRFAAGHFSKIRFRNSSSFEPMSVHAGAPNHDRGVTGAGMQWKPSENFGFGGVNQYGWDMFNTFYAETERHIPLSGDWSLRGGMQFADQRSVGDEILGAFENQFIGGRFSVGYRSLIASSSFTWTGKGNTIRNPWGGNPSYNSLMLSDFNRNSEKAILLGLSYNFTDLGLTGLAFNTSLAYGDTPDSGADTSPDQREFDVTIDYQPPVKLLENFWLRARYAINDREGANERTDIRLILNYSVLF